MLYTQLDVRSGGCTHEHRRGGVPAYKFGRVIRLKQSDVEAFIEASKVQPGSLKHLYPEARTPPGDAPEDAAEATGGNLAYEDCRGTGSGRYRQR